MVVETKNEREARVTIAVLPGDGIGPEVIQAAVAVLRAVWPDLSFREALIGGAAYDQLGTPLPEATLAVIAQADAALLGAVGGPRYDALQQHLRPEQGLLQLRKRLDLFANLRPVKLFSPLADASTLKFSVIEGLDLLFVRELTGDVYFGQPRGRAINAASEQEAFDTMRYSEREIRRVARRAFSLARQRRSVVCSVDKANVLETSQLWREIVSEEHQRGHTDLVLTHQYVDNAAMQLVRNPKQFDVILTGNLFGDILSDQASMLTGSIGLLPSASMNEQGFGLYEPIHGSAPDIAGKNQANPLGAILSAAMLCHNFQEISRAMAIEAAVLQTLQQGFRTADIAQSGHKIVGTREMTDAVLENLP